ncbi:MAG: hypothetical protein RID07_18970 [Lacipirellulaceae bacterium]
MSFRRKGKLEYIRTKEWEDYVLKNREKFDSLCLPSCITECEDAFWDFFDLGYYPYFQHHERIPTIAVADLEISSRRLLLEIIKDRIEKYEPGRYFTSVDPRYLEGKRIALGINVPAP